MRESHPGAIPLCPGTTTLPEPSVTTFSVPPAEVIPASVTVSPSRTRNTPVPEDPVLTVATPAVAASPVRHSRPPPAIV